MYRNDTVLYPTWNRHGFVTMLSFDANHIVIMHNSSLYI